MLPPPSSPPPDQPARGPSARTVIRDVAEHVGDVFGSSLAPTHFASVYGPGTQPGTIQTSSSLCGTSDGQNMTVLWGYDTPFMGPDVYGDPIPGSAQEQDNVLPYAVSPGHNVTLGENVVPAEATPAKMRQRFLSRLTQAGPGIRFRPAGTYDRRNSDGTVTPAPGIVDPIEVAPEVDLDLRVDESNAPNGALGVDGTDLDGAPRGAYVRTDGVTVHINADNDLEVIGGGGGGLAERETAGPGIAFVGAPGETPTTPTATALADLTGSLAADTYTYQTAWHNAAGVGPLSVSVSATADATHTKIEIDDTITVPGAEDIDELWLYRSDTSDSTPKFLLAVPAVGTSVTFTDDGTVTPGDAWSAGAGRIIETRLQTDAMTGANISGLEDTAGPGQDELSWPGVPVQANDAAVATRRTLDFKDSASVTFTVTDNPTDKRVEVSAAAAAGGGGDPASRACTVVFDDFGDSAITDVGSGAWKQLNWNVVQFTVPDADDVWVGGSGSTAGPYPELIVPVSGFYQVDLMLNFQLLSSVGDFSAEVIAKLSNFRGGGDGEDYIQSASAKWGNQGYCSVSMGNLMYCKAGGSLTTYTLYEPTLATGQSINMATFAGDCRLSAYLVRTESTRPAFYPWT